MKKTYLVLAIISFLSINFLSAQGCNFFYPLVEDNRLQYQIFSANDELESIQEVNVRNVKEFGGKTEAIIMNKMFDSNHTLIHETEFPVTCTGNSLKFDMSTMLDPSVMAAFEGMEVKMEANDIIIPANIEVGDKLGDASLNATVKMAGMTITDMKLHIKNRKVESKESVTTPAGTFDALKVTHDYVLSIDAMGMSQNTTLKTIDFMVKDLGTVRSETYDEKGVLQSYTVLSKIF